MGGGPRCGVRAGGTDGRGRGRRFSAGRGGPRPSRASCSGLKAGCLGRSGGACSFCRMGPFPGNAFAWQLGRSRSSASRAGGQQASGRLASPSASSKALPTSGRSPACLMPPHGMGKGSRKSGQKGSLSEALQNVQLCPPQRPAGGARQFHEGRRVCFPMASPAVPVAPLFRDRPLSIVAVGCFPTRGVAGPAQAILLEAASPKEPEVQALLRQEVLKGPELQVRPRPGGLKAPAGLVRLGRGHPDRLPQADREALQGRWSEGRGRRGHEFQWWRTGAEGCKAGVEGHNGNLVGFGTSRAECSGQLAVAVPRSGPRTGLKARPQLRFHFFTAGRKQSRGDIGRAVATPPGSGPFLERAGPNFPARWRWQCPVRDRGRGLRHDRP